MERDRSHMLEGPAPALCSPGWSQQVGWRPGPGRGAVSTYGGCTKNTSRTKACMRRRERSTDAVPEGGKKVSKLCPGASAWIQATRWQYDRDKHKDGERKRRKNGGKVVLGKEKKTGKEKGVLESEMEMTQHEAGPVRQKCPELLSQSPAPEALVRQNHRKDPRAFFAFPMTDSIAPGS